MAYWSLKAAEYEGSSARIFGLLPFLICFVTVIFRLAEGKGRFTGRNEKKKAEGKTAEQKGRKLWPMLFLLILAGWLRMGAEMRETPLEAVLKEQTFTGTAQAEGIITKAGLKNDFYTLELDSVRIWLDGASYWEKRISVTLKAEAVGRLSGNPRGQPEDKTEGQWEGKRIRVKGKISLFESAKNPGEFDYRLYCRSKKMRCRVQAKQAEFCDGETPAFLKHRYQFKAFTEEAISFLFGEKDAGVYKAVLLGDRRELAESDEALFQDGGIAHILAISGLHVSLIGMSLFHFLRKRGRSYKEAGLIAAAVLCFYGTITGFSASVFRAVFMIFCAFLAAYLGRTYDLLSAMALSLLLLAFDSPYLLLTGGLQLSYGAVTAVGIQTERAKKRRREASPFGVSLAVQLVTLPMILYHFFQFPVYGILLNLIVIPLMSYAAGSGILAAGLYGVYRILAASAAFLTPLAGLLRAAALGTAGPGHYILELYRILCRISLNLPGAVVTAGRPDGWKIALYYTILFAIFFCRADRGEGSENGNRWLRRKFYSGAACAAAVVVLMTRPIHGMEVFFLDVGQGDGIFMETKNAKILVDCGSSQYKNVGRDRLLPFLKSRGITCLDYILVSHGDSDHINGIVWILEENEVKVKTLILPCAGRGEEVYRKLEELALSRGASVCYMEEGQRIEAGRLSLQSLYPERTLKTLDRNDHSLVLKTEYGSFTMILTGDIGAEGEKKIAEKQNAAESQRVTVLKAAHHGSATSTCQEFLDRLNPSITILSYGEGNSYGHPSGEVVERLKTIGTQIWRTARCGAIRLRTNGKKIKTDGFLTGKKKG